MVNVINSTELSPSRVANRSSGSKEIPRKFDVRVTVHP